MDLPAKAIYLNGRRVGIARTWDEVAVRLLEVIDHEFTGFELSRMHSEGPNGFFLVFSPARALA